ncbi:MAG: CoA transferase [Alcaligenaceae bacterium]|nr:CoA transferase [Alcaligenaceae bacterium]
MFDTLLKDLRVLDLTQNVAGPFCTQILGDLGAEIIKIERPGTGDDTRAWRPPELDGHSSTFLALNRNKRSICIDLATPEGQDLVRRLAQSADVVVHSMKPGSAEKMGLGSDTLRALNPRLVYCAISAFGETGPLASLPGYDPLMQAFSGIMSVTGNEGDDPVRVSVSLIDMGTGMWSALGILAAIMARQTSGEGAVVSASLLETGLSWMTVFVAGYLASGQLPRKMGSAMSMAAPYELFKTEDGYVFIAAGNDRLFAKVCAALKCPELCSDPRFATNADRVRNRDALKQTLTTHTQTWHSVDLANALRREGAPCSELNTIDQALDHEQVKVSGMVTPLPSDHAPNLRVVGLPLRMNGERVGQHQPPPLLGADTDAILAGLGLQPQELTELRTRGITG